MYKLSILETKAYGTSDLENMQDKQNIEQNLDSVDGLKIPKNFVDRRKKRRSEDAFYRVVIILNLLAWVTLVAALLVFHYARPDFITGVQSYWGIEGRDFWSPEHIDDLILLLQICLLSALVAFVMQTRRNRRKTDSFAYNILILLVISIVSLTTIYSTV